MISSPPPPPHISPQTELDVGLTQEVRLVLPGGPNVSVCVAAYTGGGEGPWSAPLLLPCECVHPADPIAPLTPYRPLWPQ